MSYLIQHEQSGERQHVKSLDGYDTELWVVIAAGEDARPKEHADFDEEAGKWVIDNERKASAEKAAKARSMTREELLDRIEALEKRFADGR